jgi:hypothetical protein
MIFTVNQDVALKTIRCCACDLLFAVPQTWLDERQEDGRSFCCPNGHQQHFTERESERLRRQLKQAEAQVTHLRDQRDAAERSARAYRGQVTKIRKRVGNGVCPCCKRSFQNLGRHMVNQHPDFAHAESE